MIALLIVFVLLAFYVGRIDAHSEIAKECDRLGGFYVGDKTYRCVSIEPKSMSTITSIVEHGK